MIRVGIFGATGYAGYELLKILQRHPQAEATFISSQSYAGLPFSEVYPCPYEQVLVAPDDAPVQDVDVAFLCTPHGASAPFAQRVIEAGAKCVDLSADFRIRDLDVYAKWYGAHGAPSLIGEAVYGLTEVYREQIASAKLVANPGCYPTGPLLALYPLLQAGALSGQRVIVDAKSGVSGAGASPSKTTHYVNVNENLSAYKIGRSHRHVPEMEQELSAFAGQPMRATFVPHLLPVSRGILSTIYVSVEPSWTPEKVVDLWRSQYQGEPFVQVLEAGSLATLAHSAYTNRCALSVGSTGGDGELVIVTSIDNLLKGASGQAVQNMNAMFGLDECLGLWA